MVGEEGLLASLRKWVVDRWTWLAMALVGLIGMAVVVGSWQLLTQWREEFPKEKIRQCQGDLAKVILAVSRLERAIDGVSVSASQVNRNELTLSVDALHDLLAVFDIQHTSLLPVLRPALNSVKAAMDATRNMQSLFEDATVRTTMWEGLNHAFQELNKVYFQLQEENQSALSRQREWLMELRWKVAGGVVWLILLSLSLLGLIYAMHRMKQQVRESSHKSLLSHDIRTPLHGLLGMGQLLSKTELSPLQKHYLQSMLESADQLYGTLREMMVLQEEEKQEDGIAEGQTTSLLQEPPLVERPAAEVTPLAILVVEDEWVNAEVIKQLLLYEGHRVTVVHRGADALEELQWDSFQVILMDLRMPDMDGVETTRRIRQQEVPWRNIPIIVVTADVTAHEYERCMQAGVNRVLAKPLKMEVLRSELFALIPDQVQKDPLLDEKVLAHLLEAMGQQNLLELVGKLVDQCRQGRQEEWSALLVEDNTPLRNWAHKLSGGAAFLGLTALHRAAANLEQLARESDHPPEQLSEVLEELLKLARNAQQQLSLSIELNR
ncbi:MAG: response regulator [Magnetococcales bacterium]|nr:response regulator [Magnetococcales bacterium]NGZ25470.1 response regulator [Magnetococcales bacterium]